MTQQSAMGDQEHSIPNTGKKQEQKPVGVNELDSRNKKKVGVARA